VDWYDSAEAQQLLAYQEHAYEMYLDTLRAAVAKMLEE
jgi:hypothetical protein